MDATGLFMSAYDSLSAEPKIFTSGRARAWYALPEVQRLAQAVDRAMCESGAVSPALVAAAERLRGRGSFGLVLGLDRALGRIPPVNDPDFPAGLRWLATNLARYGRYNQDDSNGALLPRRTYPTRPTEEPETLRDWLLSVVRILPSAWRHELRALPVTQNQDLDSFAGSQLTIACVPFLDDLAQVSLTVHEDADGGAGYYLGPTGKEVDPDIARQLEDRIAEVIDLLDASEAHIGLLPEAALAPPLLSIWQDVSRRKRRPESSNLCWILAGTGPWSSKARPSNRAYLLSRRRGRVIASQDKRFGFTLTHDVIKAWRLQNLVKGHTTLHEHIERGDHTTLIESRIGRVAVAICEDLGRTADMARLLGDAAVNLVLVPIFAKEIQLWRWETTAAHAILADAGGTFVICNSLAVARHMMEAEPADGYVTTVLVAGSGQQGYTIDPLEYRTRRGTDISYVRLRTLPFGPPNLLAAAGGAEPATRNVIPWVPETLPAALRSAVSNQRLTLVYQPQVALDREPSKGRDSRRRSRPTRFDSVEALVRWDLPLHGRLHPAVFLPIAEQEDLMLSLDLTVLRLACAQGAEWLLGRRARRIAVKVSKDSASGSGLVQAVWDVLNKTHLPPYLLELEFSAPEIVDLNAITANLGGLARLGITLTLDHLGQDPYHEDQELKAVRLLPVHRLKIDPRLTQQLSRGAQPRLFAELLTIARHAEQELVAAGVETKDQAQTVRRLGFASAQGYFFGRPQDAQLLVG